jgi:hypothetical protein
LPTFRSAAAISVCNVRIQSELPGRKHCRAVATDDHAHRITSCSDTVATGGFRAWSAHGGMAARIAMMITTSISTNVNPLRLCI